MSTQRLQLPDGVRELPRREFLASLGAGALAAAAPGTAQERRKPNIVFVLADDLGYGDLGCYGQKQVATPNLDRLASEGMRFSQCYSGSTVCAPSRCALMTGLHTGHCRIRGNKKLPILPADVTVAEVLKGAGYRTGMFGKWGLGDSGTDGIPNRQGFDEWFGYLDQTHAHNYYTEFLWKNEEKVALKHEYTPDLFIREALDFVKRHHDVPFFLHLTTIIPHANNELGRETGNGMEVPSDAPYSDRGWPPQERNFAAMVTRLDGHVGQLMSLLKELGLDGRTIVFFTSDNGPHREGGHEPDFFDSNGLLRGIKRDLFEGGIRVPMIARWPGRIAAGKVSDHPWAFWDFLPTAAQIAGADTPRVCDGLSVLPVLLGRRAARQHEYLYWEFSERGRPFAQAVRAGEWKGVRVGVSRPLELYNVDADLGETHDVAGQHPDVVRRIEGMLKSAHVDSSDFPMIDQT